MICMPRGNPFVSVVKTAKHLALAKAIETIAKIVIATAIEKQFIIDYLIVTKNSIIRNL